MANWARSTTGRTTVATLLTLLLLSFGAFLWRSDTGSGVPAVAAIAGVCGDSTVDVGEDCDAGDRDYGDLDGNGAGSTCPANSGCSANCQCEECAGLNCADGIDNDGDGNVDARDRECATLAELVEVAALGDTTTPDTPSLRLGLEARVRSYPNPGSLPPAPTDPTFPFTATPYPTSDSGAGVCALIGRFKGISFVDGNVACDGNALFPSAAFRCEIDGLFVMDGAGGGMLTVAGAPPDVPYAGPKRCSDPAQTPCLTTADCPSGTCGDRERLADDATNEYSDLVGTVEGASWLAYCVNAQSVFPTLHSMILGMPATDAFPGVSLGRGGSQTLSIGSGHQVVDIDFVRLRRSATLTLDGNPDSLVMRVHDTGSPADAKRLGLDRGAAILLAGGLEPEDILWDVPNVSATVRKVGLGQNTVIPGTIFAPDRRIRTRRDAIINGAAFGDRVTLGQQSTLNHRPMTVLLPSDLSVSKDDTPSTVTAGDPLTYNITVSNPGPSDAPGVVLTDTLPGALAGLEDDVTFLSATPSQGACVHNGVTPGGTVTCYLDTIPRGGSATVDIMVDTDPCTRTLSNEACVASKVPDNVSANDCDVELTSVIEDAELTIDKTDSPDGSVEEGTSLTYSITVMNTGTKSCARSVTVADTLPAALMGESVSTSQGSCPGMAFPCSLGNIAPGGTVTISVTGGTVADGTAVIGNTTELSNTATASSVDVTTVMDTEVTDVLLNQGDSCAGGSGTDCVTTHCVDGFCCNSACTGLCEACSLGGSEGTCTTRSAGDTTECGTCEECDGSGAASCVTVTAADGKNCTAVCTECVAGSCTNVAANSDPEDDCTTCRVCDGSGACTDAANGTDPVGDCAMDPVSTCDQDGECNGSGACRLYTAGTICAAQSCFDGCTQTNADTCDGFGTCTDNGTTACTPYACEGTACNTVCADNSDCCAPATCSLGMCS